MNFSLEALHKYFNKSYLLPNPGVKMGFYNFVQTCRNMTRDRSLGNLQRGSLGIGHLPSELPLLAVDALTGSRWLGGACSYGCFAGSCRDRSLSQPLALMTPRPPGLSKAARGRGRERAE